MFMQQEAPQADWCTDFVSEPMPNEHFMFRCSDVAEKIAAHLFLSHPCHSRPIIVVVVVVVVIVVVVNKIVSDMLLPV